MKLLEVYNRQPDFSRGWEPFIAPPSYTILIPDSISQKGLLKILTDMNILSEELLSEQTYELSKSSRSYGLLSEEYSRNKKYLVSIRTKYSCKVVAFLLKRKITNSIDFIMEES